MNKKKMVVKCLALVVIGVSLILNGIFIYGKIATADVAVGSICGDDIINKYNKAYEEYSNFEKVKEELKNEIGAKKNHDKDINCLVLLQYVNKNDNARYNSIETMVNSGKNPSLKIKGLSSLEYLKPVDLSEGKN